MKCARGAVIIGGYINGLGLVRALAARRIPTAVIVTTAHDIAQHSRHVRAYVSAPDLDEQPEQLVELLERRSADWPGWALYPANDGALAALAKYRDRLADRYRVIAPPWEVARTFLDKDRMLAMAQAVGIQVPRCYGPATAATAALAELRFPVIVKPDHGHRFFAAFGCKLFVARDRPELSQCLTRVAATPLSCRIFDLIPGADSQIITYCVYLDGQGEPSAGLTVRKLRQSPPFFGVARVAEVIPDHPRMREATIALLRRMGHRGMAAAEFKLDPRDGSYRFMEVNGRSVLCNALLRRAGLDLAGLAWSDYVEGRPELARPNGWPGVWINLHADLLYSLLYRRHDPLSWRDFLAPYRRPMMDAVWSSRDPRPFLKQWSRTACEGLALLWQGRQSQIGADRSRPQVLSR